MTAEQLVTRLEMSARDPGPDPARSPRPDPADAPASDPITGFGPGIALDDEVTAAVWARVQLARHRHRPRTLELLAAMADEFVELHGDRLFRDDGAIVGGFASIAGRRVMVIGHQKGAETDENIRRNFGMAHPEGYRKAMRLMELAERFRLPVVTLVDTPGASPGPGAEERGVAEAIARSIGRMLRLRTPIVTAITGEGGSGGALAIAVGDVVLALDNAVYSVITPEGCASILWRAPELAPRGRRGDADDRRGAAGARRGRPCRRGTGGRRPHRPRGHGCGAARLDRAPARRTRRGPAPDAARGALPALPAPGRIHDREQRRDQSAGAPGARRSAAPAPRRRAPVDGIAGPGGPAHRRAT